MGADAAEAVAVASGPGAVATLVLPADRAGRRAAWRPPPCPAADPSVDADAVDAVAKALRSGEPCGLFLGGAALRAAALVDASRVANATGARVLAETFLARLERGAGLPAVDRLAYLAEFAAHQLDGLRHLVLVDAKAPVSFAYPGKPSYLVPDGCEVHVLAGPGGDVAGALAALAEAHRRDGASRQPAERPERPTGDLTAQSVAQAVAALLPEHAVVVDEGNTSSLFTPGLTAGAPCHDWLTLTAAPSARGCRPPPGRRWPARTAGS